MSDRQTPYERARTFVIDSLHLMGQPTDAANEALVDGVARKVLKHMPALNGVLVTQTAIAQWNMDRTVITETCPDWPMKAWSRASAWERRPYINAAREALYHVAPYIPEPEEGE